MLVNYHNFDKQSPGAKDPLIEKMWLASGGLALPLDPTEGLVLRLPEAHARRTRHARQLAPPCTKFKLRPWPDTCWLLTVSGATVVVSG